MSEEDKVRIRVAESLASAGVGYNQLSQEVLYMLPRQFVDMYSALWHAAMGPTVRAPGDAMANAGSLGRAGNNSALKGTRKGLGQAGGAAKKLKKVFTVRDERAFRLKDRIDKRLRSIARDMQLELTLIDEDLREAARAEGVDIARAHGATRAEAERIAGHMTGASTRTGSNTQARANTKRCTTGGHILNGGWNFCPIDGSASFDPELIEKGE